MASVEEKIFTKAEQKLFSAKYEVFQKVQQELEEVATFLKEQHGVEGEGWQIGQNGFFRMPSDAPIGTQEMDILPPESNGEAKGKRPQS